MADVQPLRALHYDLAVARRPRRRGRPALRRHRRARSAPRWPPARRTTSCDVDLPEGRATRTPTRPSCSRAGGPRAPSCATTSRRSGRSTQDYTGPDGAARTRHGFFARVRVEDYGPGGIRPHERTHPGPKEDRLRLTRATRANLSPIFSLYDDPAGRGLGGAGGADAGAAALRRGHRRRRHRATACGASPTRRRSRAVQDALARRRAAHRRRPPPLRDRARLRRRDRRRGRAPLRAHVPRRAAGPGPDGLPHPPPRARPRRRSAAGGAARPRCAATSRPRGGRARGPARRPAAAGAAAARLPRRATSSAPSGCTLKDQAIADARPARTCPRPTAASTPRCSRRSCSRARSGMTEDDIGHLRGLGYSRTDDEARELVLVRRRTTPRFFLRATPGRAGPRRRGGRREHAAEVDVLLSEGPDRPAVQPAG